VRDHCEAMRARGTVYLSTTWTYGTCKVRLDS